MFELFTSYLEEEVRSQKLIESMLRSLRDRMTENLANDDFRLDCIERTLSSYKAQPNNWISPPIYNNTDLLISVRLVFWPAFYANNPHKHKTWSVTGVFHNAINVEIYNLDEVGSELTLERSIAAQEGEVGFLLPMCIHNLRNISNMPSISIHIFNKLKDSKRASDNAIWYPKPANYDLRPGFAERALLACVSALSTIKRPRSFDLIKWFYDVVDIPSVKWAALKAIFDFDPSYAQQNQKYLLQPFLA